MTNEIDMTVDSSSYDTQNYILWLAYLTSGIHNMYPQYTNSVNSISRSGASLQNQFENQQYKYGLAHWCYAFYTNHVTPYDLVLANDNGAYDAATVYQWMTNLFGAPALMWDGVSKTNAGGLVFPMTHITCGANINSVIDGDSGAVARNTGASNAMVWVSQTPIDMWHDIKTNITNVSAPPFTDVTGNNWFYALGHPTPMMSLAMMISTWRGLGLPTNVGTITLDFNSATVASSSNFTAASISSSPTIFTCNLTALRLPPSWDISPVVSNNVAIGLFAYAPSYGSFFQQVIQFTNIPSGTYNMYLSNILVWTGTDTQLKTGINIATNSVVANPLNVIRTESLYRIRDKYGVDRITGYNTHGAGDPGVNGVDLINYQSNAEDSYTRLNNRGPVLINALGVWIKSLRNNYDVPIHNVVQPVAIPFRLENALVGLNPAPFR